MDNGYGKKALKHMYDMIWQCSTVKTVLENEDQDEANPQDQAAALFVEALKNIDNQLTEALDSAGNSQDWEEGLIPFGATTQAEESHASFYYNLLTGPCRRLAQDRVDAIKDGRSITRYIESLANTTERDVIKAKIDEEVASAKEAGLNFNVLCNIWLCK